MKELYGYGLLALSAAISGGVCGYLYGWLCGVVARGNEQLERQRGGDMRLWTLLGPAVALAIFGGGLYKLMVWYLALGYAVIGWLTCLAAKGGIYWAITRRMRKNTAEESGII